MKLLLERWNKFLNEEEEKEKVIPSREEMEAIIQNDPEQEMNIDAPKGSEKMFGGKEPRKLPFDYGEWPNYINPADNMGWDFIIVPSAGKDTPDLRPAGYVIYTNEYKEKFGNDKIIIAPGGVAKGSDKKVIDDFFGEMKGRFVAPHWY